MSRYWKRFRFVIAMLVALALSLFALIVAVMASAPLLLPGTYGNPLDSLNALMPGQTSAILRQYDLGCPYAITYQNADKRAYCEIHQDVGLFHSISVTVQYDVIQQL